MLFLGGPGAGKGTQASLLARFLGIPHVSSGELLRATGRGADHRLREGELLPDDVATDVVLKRLQQPDAAHGAILDGYPRTLSQAKSLDAWLSVHGGAMARVFYLEVPRTSMIERVVERGTVSLRSDDRADVADRRAEIFARELPPLLDYYARLRLVERIDGSRPVQHVQDEIRRRMQS